MLFLWPKTVGGWIVWAIVVGAILWWLVYRLPRRLFWPSGARRLAQRHGWLVKDGQAGAGHGPSQWEQSVPAGTRFELLGEHRGFVFHVHERKKRWRRNTGDRWLYHHVVTVASTPTSYPGLTDSWTACYPTFLQWESPIYVALDNRDRPPPDGIRQGQGIISIERWGVALSKRDLLKHLNQLADLSAGQRS
ncbi:hypothetical protein [Amycolatopsis nigrescens]|uniref:hypothetical protein n=1 Tax=Amycolatopsis nigrescens TaxID=381445 RepID=UPI0012F7A8A5|nr:hypothetical protein [Amycolatopsis nigrescens]